MFVKDNCKLPTLRVWVLLNDIRYGKGVSYRIFIPSRNCRRQSYWAVFVVGWPVPFYRLGRYHNLGPLWNAHNYAAHLALLLFLKSFFCCFTTQQSGRDHPKYPPYTVGRSNRLLLLGHSETPTTDRVQSRDWTWPPRWKAAR